MIPRCPQCRQFVETLGARHNGAEGYAASFYAVGYCTRHGEVGIDWDYLGDFDPDALDEGLA